MDGLRSHSEGGDEADPARYGSGEPGDPYGLPAAGETPGGAGNDPGEGAEGGERRPEGVSGPGESSARGASAGPPSEAFGRVPELGRRHLDPRAIPAARIGNGLGNLVLAALLLGGAIITRIASDPPGWIETLLIPVALGLGVLIAIFTHVWLGIALRRVRYRVDPRGMEIVRGVFFRSVVAVPRSRVQHTDVAQGPVQRRYGIATLTMHTAGTQNSSVEITGLSHETALEIRDYFMADSGSDDAV